jgi:HD-GYP domain-containing protein (c-di-GMP phosphodiesterase class II)
MTQKPLLILYSYHHKNTEKIAKAIRYHHENIDGSGYPDGLSGSTIPVTARILAIIDSYDVMCHGSGYQLPCEREEALVKLSFCAGIKYDSSLTNAFIGMIRKEAVTV